jgi:hypothetical protein
MAGRWFEIAGAPPGAEALIGDWLEPALEAVPEEAVRRLGRCRVRLAARSEEWSSRWQFRAETLEVELALDSEQPHDLALELLLCLGQALWETLSEQEYRAYLRLLQAEIEAGVGGEIDETALEEKRKLLDSRILARSRRRLERYAQASFGATFAEYVHSLWHDVTVRTGPEHLPPDRLRHRLERVAGWFPPRPGYRLFA